MFNLDTFRLIKKTFKRFLSLTLIVLIGSAFMMGLMSTSTLMRKSVDEYNDEYELQDLQIYSQYGFCNEDYIKLKQSEVIKNIFPSKTIDLEVSIKDYDNQVARISELNKTVNTLSLIEGRWPTKANECVVLTYDIYPDLINVSDSIEVVSEYEDYLKNNKYTIVGKVSTPDYISLSLGTSNYKNNELSLIMYVPNSNFISKYYTTMYITLKDASEYTSYTNEYKEFVDEKKEELSNIAYEQESYLKNKISSEMQEKIDEAQEEFDKNKKEGEEKLNDAANKLEEANIQIVTYESQLNSLSMIINRLKSTINDNPDEIDNGLNDANSFLAQYNIDPNILYSNEVQEYAKSVYEESQKQYNSLNYQLNSAKAQYEKGLKDYNEAVLTFNDEIAKAQADLNKARQDLQELPKAKWTILDRSQHYASYMFDNTCKQMSAIGYALPVIFFLVAALVCLTTMKRLIDEQRGQIGIFVALGFTKTQIIGKYVLYALLASFIGCSIGIILGQYLFTTVIYHTWRLMYNLPDFKLSFPLNYLFLCIISFSLLMSLVTAYVVYATLKEVPASLMRPKAPKNAKEIFLEKIALIWDKLSFTSKITARNLFRYKSRFLMTVIGVAGCTGLLIIGWGIKDSISDIVSIQYSRIFNYDYQVYLKNDHHIDENIELLRQDFDYEEVVKYMSYTTKIYLSNDDDTANMIVIDPRDAYIIFDFLETDKKTPIKLNSEGVVLSEKFARNNNIKIGDYITLESLNGIKKEVRVENICEMYFQHYIFMSNALYENLFEENVKADIIAIKTSNHEKVVKDVQKLTDFDSIVDFSSVISQFENMISALNLIIAVIIITAGSLAFVVLMNITQVNISERVREIATLKVLGFNNNEVNLYIFKEILILTLFGAILGIPLGTVWHHFIMNVINMDMIMFGMNITKLSYSYAIIITFVFTGIVLLFMRKPLSKVDMVESLKSVE